jgi:hypothetical protein
MKNRKIGYTYGSVSGVCSFRKEKSIAFESTLERDLITLISFNDSVSDIIEQPLTIEYTNANGRETTYTPDFLVHFKQPETTIFNTKHKSLLIEVKPRNILRKNFQQLKPKFKIAMKYAQQNDMIFKIYDEGRIRGEYFRNISFLKRYQNLKYDESEEQRILEYLEMVGNTAIDHIIEYLYATSVQKGIALGHIWHLMANKKIVCLFDEPLNQSTVVWLSDSMNTDMEY